VGIGIVLDEEWTGVNSPSGSAARRSRIAQAVVASFGAIALAVTHLRLRDAHAGAGPAADA
jgi:hypothetical protein